jgi:hypothetical protein
MPGNRTKPGAGPTVSQAKPASAILRWLVVALAASAMGLGWLVAGLVLSSHDDAHHHGGPQAGGLQLTVGQMVWMSNDMTGQGPLKVPPGFPMDSSMMPGMQSADDNRLRLVADVRNVSSKAQRYAIGEFSVVGSGGRWTPSDDGGSSSASSALLEPGFGATVDIYFDVPIAQSKNLSIEWSRSGHKVDIPVNTSGVPSPHSH